MGDVVHLKIGRAGAPTAAIHAAGFALTRLGRRRAEIVRIVDWAAILPGPEADTDFVRLAHLAALVREPDDAGARDCMEALTRRPRTDRRAA